MLNSDYYEFRLHEVELQTSIWTRIEFRGLASLFRVASHCLYHWGARVAQEIRGIRTYRCPHLPLPFESSPYIVLIPLYRDVSNCKHGSRSLPDLTGHLTTRTDDGHAPPLGLLGKTFNLTFILPSFLVRFSAYYPIKPHAALVVVSPRQFL